MRVFDACMGPRPLREAAAQEWWAKHGDEVLREEAPPNLAVSKTGLGE